MGPKPSTDALSASLDAVYRNESRILAMPILCWRCPSFVPYTFRLSVAFSVAVSLCGFSRNVAHHRATLERVMHFAA